MSNALEVINVSKKFINSAFFSKKPIERSVLDNINFKILDGHIFGLAGLNGIGKTTIIKIILGLLRENCGEVLIFGVSNKCPSSRKSVYYLPERFYPSQYLTGYEFLDLSLSFYGKKLDKKKASLVCEKMAFDTKALDQVVRKYSKGMGQKLGLISCLLSDAKLLILDEPMTGLDPKARVVLKNALREYANNGGTVFFSSHILDDIEEICDEIAVLHDKRICFNGSPDEFMKKYGESKAEKAFLKCINS